MMITRSRSLAEKKNKKRDDARESFDLKKEETEKQENKGEILRHSSPSPGPVLRLLNSSREPSTPAQSSPGKIQRECSSKKVWNAHSLSDRVFEKEFDNFWTNKQVFFLKTFLPQACFLIC